MKVDFIRHVKNKSGFLQILVLLVCFGVAVTVFNGYKERKVNLDLEKVAVIVSESVWNLDEKSSSQYLKEVVKQNHYHYLVIRNMDSRIFAEIHHPDTHSLEAFLLTKGLFPHIHLSKEIFFRDTVIGTIEVIWVNTSIYVYANVFLFLVLICVIVHLYRRVVLANQDLEHKVEERTAQLSRERIRLEESESRLRTLIEKSPVAMVVSSPDDRILELNAEFIDLFGYTKADLPNVEAWFSLAYPDENVRQAVRKEWQEAVGNYLETQKFNVYTATVQCKDGTKKDIDFKFAHVGSQYIISFVDVTSQNRARMALIKEKQFSEDLINSMPGIFFLCRQSENRFCLTKWNKNLEDIVGISRAQLNGATLDGLIERENLSVFKKGVKRLKTETQARFELTIKDHEGKPVPLYIQAHTFEDDGSIFMMATGVDLREQKRLEVEQQRLQAQLSQAQKMEAIGTLASGIAHDFNNILAAIIGYAELIQIDMDPGNNTYKDLTEIINAGQRAVELVAQILAFSRQAEKELKPVSPHIVVKECMKLLRASLPSTIKIEEYIEKCPTVLADPTQLHQIVMNLFTNAFHAIESQRGTIGISLNQIEVTEEIIRSAGLDIPIGENICLEVKDTGIGITKANLDKIFDPYFTTKEKGKGTGLGLSIVHGIIKGYGGGISVESQLGRGTTFRIFLPVITLDAVKTDSESFLKPPGGNENIMVVDDEVPLIKMYEAILSSLGYQVTGYTDSRKAWAAYADDPERFDLVISDVTMPEMPGDLLSREILKIRPEARIIICTGFNALIDEKQALEIGIKAFISKPVLKNQLAGIVRRVLDGVPEPSAIGS